MPDKNSNDKVFNYFVIGVLINALLILGYHYLVQLESESTVIYTTNAKDVLDDRYRRVMVGKLELEDFNRIVKKMDQYLASVSKSSTNIVVLPKKFVAAGGRKIIFDLDGTILTNPGAIQKLNKRIKTQNIVEHPSRMVLQDTMALMQKQTTDLERKNNENQN